LLKVHHTDAMPIFPRPAGNGVGVFQSAASDSTSNPQGKRFPAGILVSPAFIFLTGESHEYSDYEQNASFLAPV